MKLTPAFRLLLFSVLLMTLNACSDYKRSWTADSVPWYYDNVESKSEGTLINSPVLKLGNDTWDLYYRIYGFWGGGSPARRGGTYTIIKNTEGEWDQIIFKQEGYYAGYAWTEHWYEEQGTITFFAQIRDNPKRLVFRTEKSYDGENEFYFTPYYFPFPHLLNAILTF